MIFKLVYIFIMLMKGEKSRWEEMEAEALRRVV